MKLNDDIDSYAKALVEQSILEPKKRRNKDGR